MKEDIINNAMIGMNSIKELILDEDYDKICDFMGFKLEISKVSLDSFRFIWTSMSKSDIELMLCMIAQGYAEDVFDELYNHYVNMAIGEHYFLTNLL